jgi:flagella basal body P-ring formation protein FlgA
MREALPIPELKIEITETSLFPVPPGRIEFRRDGLSNPGNPAAATPVLWHGSIVYGENRRFPIWVRVVVSAKLPRVIATSPLKHGEPIRPEQVREELVTSFPVRGDLAEKAEQVIGKAAWRDIPAEAQIRLAQLTQPPDVGRGDMVDVEVHSGNARLALTAKAETAGRSGDLISIRNLTSDRVFQARVSGKGKAVVEMEHNHAN